MAFVLATSLLLPVRIYAQRQATAAGSGSSQAQRINPADVDSHEILPLDLNPGCWQVRMENLERVNQFGETRLEIPPSQTAQLEKPMTREQLAEFEDAFRILQERYQKQGKPAEDARQQVFSGVNGDQKMFCTPTPFVDNGVEVYGSATQKCERSVEESHGVRRMRVLCAWPAGDHLLVADYQRMDANYFTGTRIELGKASGFKVASFAGKWMGEYTPHLPHSPAPTDLDGKRLIGPRAVGGSDGFRVVAMAEGKQILAAIALKMLLGQSPRMLKAYGPNSLNQFQQCYLHWSVANEAMNMMLGVQEPWKSQLADAGIPELTPSKIRENIGLEGSMYANWGNDVLLEDARQRILWEAYFSRAKTEAEKQALFQRVEQKYKVTIVDPDFFKDPANP
jgi:hypothetical protein